MVMSIFGESQCLEKKKTRLGKKAAIIGIRYAFITSQEWKLMEKSS